MRSRRCAFSADCGACFGSEPRFQNIREIEIAMGVNTKIVKTTTMGTRLSNARLREELLKPCNSIRRTWRGGSSSQRRQPMDDRTAVRATRRDAYGAGKEKA